MNAASYARRRTHDTVLLALLLAFGVVAFEHVFHSYILGQDGSLLGHFTHALRDGLLAMPLSLLAVVGGLWVAQRPGLQCATWLHLLGRAALISLSFGLLLVPALGVHTLMDTALSGTQGTFVQHEALEAGLPQLLRHGVGDAIVGQAAALPLAILGLILLGLKQGPRPRDREAPPRRQQWHGRRIRYALLLTPALWVLPLLIAAGPEAQPQTPVVFQITDNPGRWFDTGVDIAGTRSLAVISPGRQVQFTGTSSTAHTVTSLIFPTGAVGLPIDTKPGAIVRLFTPGLYVFWCKIHPYMFGAVIVDNPTTPELDLAQTITLFNGITVPTASDLALRLLRAFFVATSPSNWQVHSATGSTTWGPVYPSVPVLAFDANGTPVSVPDLNAFLRTYFGEPVTLAAVTPPSTPGVGQVWVDTQFELTSGKAKPGTATAVDAATWQLTRKVALPQISMNNPHNMWTDRRQNLIYQTQWFDARLTVFDRATGALVNDISVGPAPAHVMTRVDTDQVHVALNGAAGTLSVVELAPLATAIQRRINIGRSHPHAHWMGFDGQTMVTPNAFTADTTQFNFAANAIDAILPAGSQPIATGMMPDSSKYYVASFLDSTMTVIDMTTHAVINTINLLKNYSNPQFLAPPFCTPPDCATITGPVGALPIQTPISPDGRFMVTANTLTATVTIVDTATDRLVAMLPCDPGCHGVQFGAKQGGGYYAYVSSKFSNRMLVVDVDPNNDGDPSDATIAGSVVLAAPPGFTAIDDTVAGSAGMGGQGIVTIPVVYNGWIQATVNDFANLATDIQGFICALQPSQQDPNGTTPPNITTSLSCP